MGMDVNSSHMGSKYIFWFDELDKSSIKLAGGKGANLGEMVSAGLPVPEGFVVGTPGFDHFIIMNKLDKKISEAISGCNVENPEELNRASENIKRMIMQAEYPLSVKQEITGAYSELSYSRDIKIPEVLGMISAGREMAIVAVRSSATTEDLADASFAGQQASFLNVKGVPYLLDAIKRCWASLYEPRAIFYRAKKGFSHASIAVVVQRMVASEKSGVTFTVHPSTGENIVLHEACWGLGESLVLGRVNPDMYRVSKDGTILEKKIGVKETMHVRDIGTEATIEIRVPENKKKEQVLSEDEISRLTKYAVSIEKHYGKPQDIEWGVKGSKIYILQSRPVTTVTGATEASEEVKGEFLRGMGASPGVGTGPVKVVRSERDADKIVKGDVLVAEMTSPDFVPTMSKCVAIITEKGGTTSHAAIVSREMGIPCVVGVKDATSSLKDGEIVTVDGVTGAVYKGAKDVGAKKSAKPEASSGKRKVKVYMNLGIPEKIDEYKSLPFDGIGLMRLEFTIAGMGTHPLSMIESGMGNSYMEEIFKSIDKVASAVHPRPVVVRFSDLKSNEYGNLKGGEKFEVQESNPMLGWRGASRYVSKEFEAAFRLECRAVKKARDSHKNVWAMLPFVRTLEEAKKCIYVMEEEGLKRGEDFKVWIMAEVPSVVFLAGSFSKLCDGFSIGSNDLTQFVLGVDRDSEKLNKMGYFNERDPAVKTAISHLIKQAHKNGRTVSICGQAPSEYPELVDFLVKEGIDSVSVNPDAVERTIRLVSE